MKAALRSLVPLVLGLSFSNVALAQEPPAADAALSAASAAELPPVAEEASPAEPAVMVEQDRPGPVAPPVLQAPAKPKPVARVKSPAMIIVGSILSGVGAANLVAGSVLWAQAESVECTASSGGFGLDAAFCGVGQGFDKMIAGALLVSGGVHSAVGIPLIAAGSQAPGERRDETPAPRADLHIGATGATFTLSF